MIDSGIDIGQISYYFDNPIEGALIGGAFGGLGEVFSSAYDVMNGKDFIKFIAVVATMIGSFITSSALLHSGPDNCILAGEIALIAAGAMKRFLDPDKSAISPLTIGLGIGLGVGTISELFQIMHGPTLNGMPVKVTEINDFFGRGVNYFKGQIDIITNGSFPKIP